MFAVNCKKFEQTSINNESKLKRIRLKLACRSLDRFNNIVKVSKTVVVDKGCSKIAKKKYQTNKNKLRYSLRFSFLRLVLCRYLYLIYYIIGYRPDRIRSRSRLLAYKLSRSNHARLYIGSQW